MYKYINEYFVYIIIWLFVIFGGIINKNIIYLNLYIFLPLIYISNITNSFNSFK